MNKRFSLRLGYSCNNNCVMCFFTDKLGTFDMSTEEAKKNILLAKKENVGNLLITGGEPTMRKDFLNLLSYAIELGVPDIEVQTNGRMFYYREFTQRVAEIERGDIRLRFLIPVYGDNEKLHDSITRSSGSFSQTVKGIKNLLGYGQTVFTKTVILKPNYKHIPEIAKLLMDLNAERIVISSMCIPEDAKSHVKDVTPRFNDVMPHVYKAIRVVDGSRSKLVITSIPLCLMEGHEHLADRRTPYDLALGKDPDKVIRRIKTPENATMDFHSKTKLEKCKNCRLYSTCGGIWKEYVRIYGEEEFIPVR